MKLGEIRYPKGAHKKKKRLGCGEGSGHGGTSGRGHKGLLSRTGKKLYLGFEGGQMPLYRRIPKRGFQSPTKVIYQVVNIGDLQASFSAKDTVTLSSLQEKGLIDNINRPVKLLGRGSLDLSLTIKVHKASKSATAAVEKAGGKLEFIDETLTKINQLKASEEI